MSNLFGNLKSEGLSESEDRLGGGFQPLNTDIYTGPIKVAYAGKSTNGAQSVTVVLDLGGREYRETVFITNVKGENFYKDREDQTKHHPLPGFTLIDDLCVAASEIPLSEQETEDKVVKVWDFDAGKELPKSVPVLVGLTNKVVSLAIVRERQNKKAKNESNGKWEDIAEEKEINRITKVFHTESHLTMAEARKEQPAEFWDSWLEKNKGEVYDARTIKDGAQSGQKGRPQSGPPQANGGSEGSPAKKSLFGNKKS